MQVGSEGPRAAGERSAADGLGSLRRENALLKSENDISKKPQSSSAPDRSPTSRNDRPHPPQATSQGIRRICATLDIPRSSYYHTTVPTLM